MGRASCSCMKKDSTQGSDATAVYEFEVVMGCAVGCPILGNIRGQFPQVTPEAPPEARVHELLLLIVLVILLVLHTLRALALCHN